MKKNKVLIIIMLLTSIAGAGYYFSKETNSSIGKENKSSEKSVRVEKIIATHFVPASEYAGFVRGADQSTLTTKINGRILSLNRQEGDLVKKGEVIAILSAEELSAQVDGARKTINELRQTLKDTEKYYDQKVDEAKDNGATDEEISSAKKMRDLQMQSVKTEIVNAEGSLRVAQSYQGETIVRAPFGGVITRVFQEIGQVVGPTAPICELANSAQLTVEMFVSQETAAQIKKGEKVDLLCGDEKKDCQAIVVAVSPISEANAQKALVRMYFSKDDANVHLGQYVVAKLANDAMEQKIVLPESAILAKYNEKFVFVVEDGLAKERIVSVGQAQDGKMEIVSGLSSGEQVVVDGAYALRNNDKIKIYE